MNGLMNSVIHGASRTVINNESFPSKLHLAGAVRRRGRLKSRHAQTADRHRPADLRFITMIFIKGPCVRAEKAEPHDARACECVCVTRREPVLIASRATPFGPSGRSALFRQVSPQGKTFTSGNRIAAGVLLLFPSFVSLYVSLPPSPRPPPPFSPSRTKNEMLALIKSSAIVRGNEVTPSCFPLIR